MAGEFQLRREDYSLDPEQSAVSDSFRAYFEKSVGTALVRKAEPLGFDQALWNGLRERELIAMALPTDVGGDGAGFVELALVAEEAGRHAAPAPIVEAVVAARALARLQPSGQLLSSIRGEGVIATIAPGLGDRRLVPAGAVAEAVLARRGDDTVLITGPPPPLAANLGCAPLAWWDLTDGTVIGTADDFDQVEREWHLLTAAACVGLGQAAVDAGVRYAKERSAFGTPIGAFQAIAHPLVDASNGIDSARRLVWRAAWFCDHEPHAVGALAVSALLAAGRAAEAAGAAAIHTQGGFGFTLESDAQLFYRRAKGWALVAGDRRALLRQVAELTWQTERAVAG